MNAQYIQKYRSYLIRYFSFSVKMDTEETMLLHKIHSSVSCSVHIRKGDFIGLHLDVCTDNYFITAMKKMKELVPNVIFYIFSNDESYFQSFIEPHCKGFSFETIKGRTEEQPSVDLYLMQQCKHSIISNSGFSWMAAFLKTGEGHVIMPAHWNNDDKRKESSKNAFSMPGWIKLSV